MTFDTDTMHTEDTLDVRDIIERFEELRDEIQAQQDIIDDPDTDAEDMQEAKDALAGLDDEKAELAKLRAVLDDLKGNGGDEQFEGDWYPVGLINESYFTDAMRELVQGVGGLLWDAPAYLEIDWDATAENLRADYSSTEIDGVTFWYR